MSAPLVIAVPSKGRLQADAETLFARAGLTIAAANGKRSYRGRINDVANVEVAFLSAPEIAREIGMGAVHAGITGRDQVEETVPDFAARTELTLPLGFGRCDVVVAPSAVSSADFDCRAAARNAATSRPIRPCGSWCSTNVMKT